VEHDVKGMKISDPNFCFLLSTFWFVAMSRFPWSVMASGARHSVRTRYGVNATWTGLSVRSDLLVSGQRCRFKE